MKKELEDMTPQEAAEECIRLLQKTCQMLDELRIKHEAAEARIRQERAFKKAHI